MKSKRMKLLLRLYPSAWRQRYEDEFLAVLEETPTTWRDYSDILWGAVDAHLHPEWTTPGMWPMNHQRIFRIAGCGAILSAILMILGIIHSHYLPEDQAEFSLFFAPIALLPTITALHLLYREDRPQLSWITAVLGLVGMGSFLLVVVIGALLSLFFSNPPSPPTWTTWLFLSLFTLVGVWHMLAAILGWRTGKLPSGLTGIMATSGFGWFMVFLGILLSSLGNQAAVRQLSAILGTGLAIWLITHPVWTVWLGIWFWQQPNFQIPHSDLQTG